MDGEIPTLKAGEEEKDTRGNKADKQEKKKIKRKEKRDNNFFIWSFQIWPTVAGNLPHNGMNDGRETASDTGDIYEVGHNIIAASGCFKATASESSESHRVTTVKISIRSGHRVGAPVSTAGFIGR